MKRIHSHVSEKVLKELRTLSRKNGRKVADMVRQAIHEYICRESKQS